VHFARNFLWWVLIIIYKCNALLMKLDIDAVGSCLFGVSSPPSPNVALGRDEKTKSEKYSEGVRSHPGIRSIPFAVTKFGALGGHATALLT
jgi:hypothetical protein